jgi:TPR repeat protein
MGAGVAQDEKEGARWLRISAEAGNPAAQVDFANLLVQGGGTSQDKEQIVRWFAQAAKSGDWQPSMLGSVWSRALASSPTSKMPRCGCVAPPAASLKRSISMVACWRKVVDWRPISRVHAFGLRGRPRPIWLMRKWRSAR